MSDDEDLGLFAYRIFRKFARKNAKYFFSEIRSDLHKSGLRETLEEYFSKMLLIMAIMSPLLLFLATFFVTLLTNNFVYGIISGIGVSAVSIVAIFAYFYLSPSYLVAERAK